MKYMPKWFFRLMAWLHRKGAMQERNVRWVCVCVTHHGEFEGYRFFGYQPTCPECQNQSDVLSESLAQDVLEARRGEGSDGDVR